MCITSENDEKMTPNNGIDSPAADDSEGIGTVGGNGRLKKGPWTAAEDAILVEYVSRKGEGNWNAVQRHTGLARCGKSCRLRWANHLRPDLKKGAFTPEEEHLIIDMHSKIGNKWARMASEMPGRTDNEIKNYWNTRIKRRQRAGLPLYPPGLRLQALNENQQNDNMSSLSSGDGGHSRDGNNFEIPSIQFKNLELNQPAVYPPAFLDIPPSGFLLHGLHSPYLDESELSTMHPAKRKSELSTIHATKRLRGSESVLPGPFTYSAEYQNLTYNHPLSSSVLAGSHANLNGNTSSSEPTWATKQELPSLQTQVDNWCSPSSPLPSLESCDNLIHTPPPPEHNLSHQLSSHNSCLLDAIYGSETMNNPKNSSDMLSSLDSSMVFDYASAQLIQEAGWEPYGELTSPLGHSSSSMFSGNSVSEPEAVEAITALKKKQSSGLHQNITRVRRQTRSAGQIFCFLRKSHNALVVDDFSRSWNWKHMDIRSNPLHMIPLDERPVLKSLFQK